MASSDWVSSYTTNTTSTFMPLAAGVTTGYLYAPYSSGSVTYGVPAALPAAPKTPLQWLDDEIEKTCALARSAA